MPNARIHNDRAHVGVRNDSPNISVSSFQTGHTGHTQDDVNPGMPIGLLLVLTHAIHFHPDNPLSSERPNVYITNA